MQQQQQQQLHVSGALPAIVQVRSLPGLLTLNDGSIQNQSRAE